MFSWLSNGGFVGRGLNNVQLVGIWLGYLGNVQLVGIGLINVCLVGIRLGNVRLVGIGLIGYWRVCWKRVGLCQVG